MPASLEMRRRAFLLLMLLVQAGGLLTGGRLLADVSDQPSGLTPAREDAPEALGKWSSVVAGLRGRLVLQGPGATNPKDDFTVYFELQNVSKAGASKDVFFSLESIVWKLTDVAGRPAEEVPLTILAPFDLGAWTTLPAGSTKRWMASGGRYSGSDDEPG